MGHLCRRAGGNAAGLICSAPQAILRSPAPSPSGYRDANAVSPTLQSSTTPLRPRIESSQVPSAASGSHVPSSSPCPASGAKITSWAIKTQVPGVTGLGWCHYRDAQLFDEHRTRDSVLLDGRYLGASRHSAPFARKSLNSAAGLHPRRHGTPRWTFAATVFAVGMKKPARLRSNMPSWPR